MATKTITQLEPVTAPALTDAAMVPVDDAAGATRKASIAQLRTAIGAASALTGDVTGSGIGSITTTIANRAVTFAKLRAIASLRLLGRGSSGAGDVEELTLGPGLSLVGGVLDAAAPAAAAPSATLLTHRTFHGF
jgi:hypothetical protein